jgi:tetratricopeptide (TPR) repeat protein
VGNASRVAGAVLALVLVVGSAELAGAATPEETARARESFQRGQIHFDLKEYQEALRHFKDAYRLAPDPVLLFNIAQCHVKLGQPEDALGFYRNYLRRAPSAANRPDVEKKITELEEQLARAPRKPPPAPVPAGSPRPDPAPGAQNPPVGLSRPPSPAERPRVAIHRRWWFWAAAAAVVGGGLATTFAIGRRGQVGDCRGMPNCLELP